MTMTTERSEQNEATNKRNYYSTRRPRRMSLSAVLTVVLVRVERCGRGVIMLDAWKRCM